LITLGIFKMAKFRAPLNFLVITPALTVAELQTLANNLSTLQAAAGNFTITCGDQLEAASLTITEQYENNMTQCSMSPINKTKVGLESSVTISIADDRPDLFALATNAQTVNQSSQVLTGAITTGSPTITGTSGFAATVNIGDVLSGVGIPIGTRVAAKPTLTTVTMNANATATNATASVTSTPITPSLIRIGDQAGLTQGSVELPYRTVLMRPLSGNAPTPDINRWLIFPRASIEGEMTTSFGLQNQFSYSLKMTAFDPEERGYKVLRGNTALLV
jgi:hypothetical protein